MNDNSHRDAGNAENFHKAIKIPREFALGRWESFNNSAWRSNPKISLAIIFPNPPREPPMNEAETRAEHIDPAANQRKLG